jgi:hypothetical protein
VFPNGSVKLFPIDTKMHVLSNYFRLGVTNYFQLGLSNYFRLAVSNYFSPRVPSIFVREHGVHAGPKDYFVVVVVVIRGSI